MRMVNIVKGANLKKLSILVILLISVTCLTFAFMPASAVSHAASSYSETPDATVFENGTKYRVPIGSRYMVYKLSTTKNTRCLQSLKRTTSLIAIPARTAATIFLTTAFPTESILKKLPQCH